MSSITRYVAVVSFASGYYEFKDVVVAVPSSVDEVLFHNDIF